MCIICNCSEKPEVANQFLRDFSESRESMLNAADAMLACSKIASTEADRRAYYKTYKRMVMLIREWSRIEHDREN